MTPEEAINVLARHMIATTVEFASEDAWGNLYPEIGERDFDLVVDTAMEMVKGIEPSEYREAYALLEKRAHTCEGDNCGCQKFMGKA